MMQNLKKSLQNTTENNFKPIPALEQPDSLRDWAEWYFDFEVTTAASSRKVQRRDLALLLSFLLKEYDTLERSVWTPRASRAFQDYLRNTLDEEGKRHWGDRTINRIFAHLKTFASFIHKHRSFPLGNPLEKLKHIPVGMALEVERALTASERNRLLDGADLLVHGGMISRDRNRYKEKRRPQRKNYRPYRNRAIVYLLIETGMRCGAVPKLNIDDIDFTQRKVSAVEKGGAVHEYRISKDGLRAIRDYLERERAEDFEKWQSTALFLSCAQNAHGTGRLHVRGIGHIWAHVCQEAGVVGKTPHSARHAMGRYIMEQTGNVAAVQRQLGHKNAAYSLQYARITASELDRVLDER